MQSLAKFDFRALLALLCALALAACGTTPRQRIGTSPSVPRSPVADMPVKIGKPYQVAGQWYHPADEPNYDEVGYASWYGDPFHGKATANGERFDMNMVGAAHKTLPLPSYVEVTALDTGRTILVRVNDRGPFVANRIIDLSRRAAEQLGITRQGIARVRVKRVHPDESDRLALRSGRAASQRPLESQSQLASLNMRFQRRLSGPIKSDSAPAVVTAAAADTSSGLFSASAIGGYFIQIGAYGERIRADSLASRLGATIDSMGNMWRVRLGPFFDENLALATLARVQGEGYQDARLIRPIATN